MIVLQEHNDSSPTTISEISTERKAGEKRQFKPIPAFTEKQLLRFWSRVDRRGPDDCWPWTGHVTKGKWGAIYGMFNGYRPHRITYTLLVGPIPDNLTLDHIKEKCSLGALCCNPAHCEPVTQSENTMRYESGAEPWEAEDESLVTLCASCHENETIYGRLVERQLIQAIRRQKVSWTTIECMAALIQSPEDAALIVEMLNHSGIKEQVRVVAEDDYQSYRKFLGEKRWELIP